jgi:hypothetical protein
MPTSPTDPSRPHDVPMHMALTLVAVVVRWSHGNRHTDRHRQGCQMIALAFYAVGFVVMWVFTARAIVLYGVFGITDSPADRGFSVLLGLVAGWLWPLVVPILMVGGAIYKLAFSTKKSDARASQ